MKSQKLTLIILLAVTALLLIEFAGKRLFATRTAQKTEKTKKSGEPENSAKDTTAQISAADSIAALYAPSIFKNDQKKHNRVKEAYKKYGKKVSDLYNKLGLDENSLEIYLRAFKKEKLLEVWAKDKNKKQYSLLTSYDFCKSSGTLGPKRKEGDLQIPEGFYRIVTFNPESQFYLSLGINYPNRSDKVLGDTTNLGGDIFIHGDCVTVGCIPITDEKIQELYIIAVDAKAVGQGRIPVSIFPTKLDDANFKALTTEYVDKPQLLKFWASLKEGYQTFEKCKKLPTITFGAKGEYICKSGC